MTAQMKMDGPAEPDEEVVDGQPHYPKVLYEGIESNSMLLKKTIVKGMLEFAPNKLLVHIYPKDMLVIHNWDVVHNIVESNPGNNTKNWFFTMPQFNIETFPFVITTGIETSTLVNVRDGTSQVLMKTPTWNHGPQNNGFCIA